MRSRDGTLWVASGSGMHRHQTGAWIVNGEAEGLRSDTVYKVFQDSRGRIWGGTSRGVSRFHTDADRDAPRATIARSNHAETSPDGSATIAFSAFDRWKQTAADRLLFSSRIDGGSWSERVLVAEDNAVNQLVIRRLLQRMGHSVVMAANGEEAVRFFDNETPDVVLMDVQMPVMDGFEATKAIRDRERGGPDRVPIIAMTAHAMQGYREECLDAGMTDYVAKPIRVEDLTDAIARVCAGAQLRGRSPAA